MIVLANADSRRIPLADGVAQMCLTSPPYFNLRQYDSARWEGGDPNCEHTAIRRGESMAGSKSAINKRSSRDPIGRTCRLCGAQRVDAQIGAESSLQEYTDNLVAVFREVKRVLRKDGVLLLNLADCYNGSQKGYNGNGTWYDRTGTKQHTNIGSIGLMPTDVQDFKPKDLIPVSWTVAMALQQDGWFLRQAFNWLKWNTMPGSQQDRPTTSHEYWFLFSKSRHYYWDHHAITIPLKGESIRRNQSGWHGNEDRDYVDGPQNHMSEYFGSDKAKSQTSRTYRTSDTFVAGLDDYIKGVELFLKELRRIRDNGTGLLTDLDGDIMASVFNTEGYEGKHYATFPSSMIEPFVRAGSSERTCEICNTPWETVVEETPYEPEIVDIGVRHVDASRKDKQRKLSGREYNDQKRTKITGWRTTCKHDNTGTGKSIVLDPFVGSGTTVKVAMSLQRSAVGLDLSYKYLADNASGRTSAVQVKMF